MKKLLIYYIVVLTPFPFLLWALFAESELFILLLVTYGNFRVWYDRRRLIRKGVIGADYGYFRFMIHGNIDFFRQLYLEP